MPNPVHPQQYRAPRLVMPQLLLAPIARVVNVSPPATATGVRRSINVPSPSCPCALPPQQYAAPLGVSPPLWPALPSESDVNVCPPATAVGTSLFVVVPSPIWPRSLRPQQ